jgi:hypothetical protein
VTANGMTQSKDRYKMESYDAFLLLFLANLGAQLRSQCLSAKVI